MYPADMSKTIFVIPRESLIGSVEVNHVFPVRSVVVALKS